MSCLPPVGHSQAASTSSSARADSRTGGAAASDDVSAAASAPHQLKSASTESIIRPIGTTNALGNEKPTTAAGYTAAADVTSRLGGGAVREKDVPGTGVISSWSDATPPSTSLPSSARARKLSMTSQQPSAPPRVDSSANLAAGTESAKLSRLTSVLEDETASVDFSTTATKDSSAGGARAPSEIDALEAILKRAQVTATRKTPRRKWDFSHDVLLQDSTNNASSSSSSMRPPLATSAATAANTNSQQLTQNQDGGSGGAGTALTSSTSSSSYIYKDASAVAASANASSNTGNSSSSVGPPVATSAANKLSGRRSRGLDRLLSDPSDVMGYAAGSSRPATSTAATLEALKETLGGHHPSPPTGGTSKRSGSKMGGGGGGVVLESLNASQVRAVSGVLNSFVNSSASKSRSGYTRDGRVPTPESRLMVSANVSSKVGLSVFSYFAHTYVTCQLS